jgi:hypothetical protein
MRIPALGVPGFLCGGSRNGLKAGCCCRQHVEQLLPLLLLQLEQGLGRPVQLKVLLLVADQRRCPAAVPMVIAHCSAAARSVQTLLLSSSLRWQWHAVLQRGQGAAQADSY